MALYCRSLLHLYDADGTRLKPTIQPTNGFSANADAEHLKKAMRGAGTDEQAIIEILGRRTCAERMLIRDAYPNVSSKTLPDALTNEISGDFKHFAIMLTQSPWEVMAEALFKAMKGQGTKERVLNEILAGCSKEDIPELKKAYETVSGGVTLEEAIISETSGDYKEALLLVLAGQTDEPTMMQLKSLSPDSLASIVNAGLAETDAKEIRASGEGRPGTAEQRFMRPIINRSPWQLKAAADAYNKLYGRTLQEAIESETSGDFKNFLVARLKYAIDRPAFFAEILHMSMSGPGTKDATLQRTLALRADTDLESVKAKYEELYGESLEAAIQGDTSKDYGALCVRLVSSA